MLINVVGHTAAIQMLETHLEHPATSYIFHGPNGVGKKWTAIQMFRQMACQGDKTVSCACKSCTQVGRSTHQDLKVVSPTGLSYGVDQIRDIIDKAVEYPDSAPFKMYVIDEAEKLTPNASNSLLKILEEGPKKTVFVFLLEEESGLIDTIRSRSVSIRYTALAIAEVTEYLKKYSDDIDKVKLSGNLSGGSIGIGLSYLRGGRLSDRDKALELLQTMNRRPYHQLISLVDDEENIDSLIYLLRYLLVDMALIDAGVLDRVANFDKIDVLRSIKSNIGIKSIQVGLISLNSLHSNQPRIKATHKTHFKNVLFQIKKAI